MEKRIKSPLLALAVLALVVTFFGVKNVLSEPPQNGTRIQRPRVSEEGGWKKFSKKFISRMTQTSNDSSSRKAGTTWLKVGEAVSKGKSGPITEVYQVDNNGDALLWADKSGVHYFDLRTKEVKTAIDMVKSKYLFGPKIDYPISSDASNSYLLVRWVEKSLRDGLDRKTVFLALLDSKGKILWKKNVKLSSAKCIGGESVAGTGNVFVVITGCEGAEEFGHPEIWDKDGKTVARLTGYTSGCVWEDEGKSLKYHWSLKYPGVGNEKVLWHETVVDTQGNWVAGDKF